MPPYLPLLTPATWSLLTCSKHRPGDVELRQQGAFTEVRCRECAREAATPQR